MGLSVRTPRENIWRYRMKITALVFAVGLAVCAFMVPVASAETSRPSINRVEHREELRIRQGVRSGQLTQAEAARLQAEQARIRVNERYNRMDGGKLTARERVQLYNQLHQASRHIYNQKHDKQVRN